MAAPFWQYALVAVVFTYGGLGVMFWLAVRWERFERRLVDRHSATIHTFPERSASITRIYGDKDGAA